MFNIINNFILTNIETFAKIIAGMLVVIIGLPFVSFKGGIPRFAGVILDKGKAILGLLIGFLFTFFVIIPFSELLVKIFLQNLIDFTIPLLFLAIGIFIMEWDLRMRWKFHWYWIPFMVLGALLMMLEIFLY